MPKLLDKRKVLNGRGTVVCYVENPNKFYYRQIVKGTNNYRSLVIDGVRDIEEATEKAIEVAIALEQEKPVEVIKPKETQTQNVRTYRIETTKNRRSPLTKEKGKTLLTDAIDAFVHKEELRANSGVVKQATPENKKRILGHLKNYFKENNLIYTSDIKVGVFQDYVPYRKKEGTPNLMLQNEVKTIKDWVSNYLYVNELINPYVANDKKLYPRVEIRPDDLLKNPAIMPDDWKTILSYVRDVYIKRKRNQPRHPRATYTAYVFWHFLLLAKNTGMDKEELMKLKWKNIETVDEGRIDSKGERKEWLVTYIYTTRSKTGVSREIPCNQGRELRRLLKIQKGYIERHKLSVEITPNTLVFGNVFEQMKPYSKSTFHHMFRKEVFLVLKGKGLLKGHKFSPHDYTLKSLRSTFIEDKLRSGTDIFLLARVAGHDPKMLMKHYEKMDIRTRASELTIDTTKFGETKPTKGNKIDLLNEQTDDIRTNRDS